MLERIEIRKPHGAQVGNPMARSAVWPPWPRLVGEHSLAVGCREAARVGISRVTWAPLSSERKTSLQERRRVP